jgi:hypothetical protein
VIAKVFVLQTLTVVSNQLLEFFPAPAPNLVSCGVFHEKKQKLFAGGLMENAASRPVC